MDDIEYYKQWALSQKDIVKINGEYRLENSWHESDNWIKPVRKFEDCDHECSLCRHCFSLGNGGACDVYNKLANVPKNYVVQSAIVRYCEAYSPLKSLNIIHSENEMISFIENVKNCFKCPEDYEYYFGFERKWDEETGKILETVREYYNKGGLFKNIPIEYPCVISFDVNGQKPLEWVFIGDN